MARIKIKDLPKDMKISKEELKRVRGGALFIKFSGVVDGYKEQVQKSWSDILSFSPPLYG